MTSRKGIAIGVALALAALQACSRDQSAAPGDQTPSSAATAPSAPAPTSVLPGAEEHTASSPEPARRVRPDDLDVSITLRTVRHLADRIGPRLATGPAYERAARWVGGRLESYGYVVRRQGVDVPAGDSWGVPVAGGRSVNVVAAMPGFDPAAPHLVVGAHLDTVAVAPGAEDNGSGVGTMLAVAEAVKGRRTRLPVVFVAFGAEEPRGPGDDQHHFGSRAYVAALSPVERRAVRGMVSLDRVGVGQVVPVGSADESGSDADQRALLLAARRADAATVAGYDRSSDHWSFARAGLPGVRLGSTPYAGYHSEGDVPAVVAPAQLRRTGRIVLAWLGGETP